MTSRTLTFPAPKRCSCNCGTMPAPKIKGKPPTTTPTWEDHPWSENEVREAQRAGAFFQRGRHDFADKEAEVAALGTRPKSAGDVGRWLKQLSPSQLDMLREILSKEAGL